MLCRLFLLQKQSLLSFISFLLPSKDASESKFKISIVSRSYLLLNKFLVVLFCQRLKFLRISSYLNFSEKSFKKVLLKNSDISFYYLEIVSSKSSYTFLR